MKRLLSVLILIAMLFLCACGNTVKHTESTEEPKSSVSQESEAQVLTPSSASSTTVPSDAPVSTPTSSESAEPAGPHISFTKKGDGGTVAVWWWNANDALNPEKRDPILDFLEMNAVNEIYFCYPSPNHGPLYTFVKEANAHGMQVSLLSGDVAFIEPDNPGSKATINEFLTYQKTYPDAPMKSLHLDVEPHQSHQYAEKRDEIIQKYADYVVKTCQTLHDAGEKVEFDIPFWFDGFTTTQNGETVDLLTLIAQHADGMTIMAYRDTWEGIYGFSEKEMELARTYGCRIILGVDCYSTEGTDVSFLEDGQQEMYRQLKQVYKKLWRFMKGKDYGIAIHYVDTWMKLKE